MCKAYYFCILGVTPYTNIFVLLLGRKIDVYPRVNDKVISLVLRCTFPTIFLDSFTPGNSIVEVIAPRKDKTRENPHYPLKNKVLDTKKC